MPKVPVVDLSKEVPKDESGKIPFDDGTGECFTDPNERASRIEGYGPYEIAVLPDDTDSDEGGFLEHHNVRDRI